MRLAHAGTDAQDSTLAPVSLAVGTDDGTEAERWSPLACPRSRGEDPGLRRGGRARTLGSHLCRHQRCGTWRAPRRHRAGPAGSPQPGRAAPPAGSRGAGMGRGRDLGRRRFLAPPRCGRPGHVTARPRARWQSGGAPGGVRDSAARAGPRGTHGQARDAAAASAAAKFPGVACARAQGPRAGT